MKPTISLDADLYTEIRDLAEVQGVTFSAWMADAARARLRNQALFELAAEVLTELGGITQEGWDAAGVEMGLPPRPIPPGIPIRQQPDEAVATD